jgi:Cu-Zn family superoxide dismutase
MRKHWLLGGILLLAFATPAFSREQAIVNFINTKGEPVGHATLTETKQGVLIHTDLSNIPPGWHAFHIHSVGQCTPSDFTSAGGHFNPDHKEHGYENPKGSHAGDLPNVYVGADGQLQTDMLAPGVTLSTGDNRLLDSDGSAIVLHQGQDDYSTNPAGNAGPRIICGALKP